MPSPIGEFRLSRKSDNAGPSEPLGVVSLQPGHFGQRFGAGHFGTRTEDLTSAVVVLPPESDPVQAIIRGAVFPAADVSSTLVIEDRIRVTSVNGDGMIGDSCMSTCRPQK